MGLVCAGDQRLGFSLSIKAFSKGVSPGHGAVQVGRAEVQGPAEPRTAAGAGHREKDQAAEEKSHPKEESECSHENLLQFLLVHTAHFSPKIKISFGVFNHTTKYVLKT